MPEYLKKAIAYFKIMKFLEIFLISVSSAVAGAFVFDRILRRDEDEEDQ